MHLNNFQLFQSVGNGSRMISQKYTLQVVIQFPGNPGSNKKVTFKFTFFVLLSLIVNVPFCHEDSDRERCKLDILIVVS